MKDLKVIGKEQVAGYEFTGIEGGFGDGTRGMLVRDIANIHNKPTYVINQAINMNIKRFKDGVDIVNLKTKNVVINLVDNGFSQNAINRSKYIYLLSERGYSKLLKILEDDTAWDIYDKFVDGYFNMRRNINEQALPANTLEIIKNLLLVLNTDHNGSAKLSNAETINWDKNEETVENAARIFHKYVKDAMYDRNMKLYDLADAIGVNQSVLSLAINTYAVNKQSREVRAKVRKFLDI